MALLIAALAAAGAYVLCIFFDKTNELVYSSFTIRDCIALCVFIYVLRNWSSK